MLLVSLLAVGVWRGALGADWPLGPELHQVIVGVRRTDSGAAVLSTWSPWTGTDFQPLGPPVDNFVPQLIDIYFCWVMNNGSLLMLARLDSGLPFLLLQYNTTSINSPPVASIPTPLTRVINWELPAPDGSFLVVGYGGPSRDEPTACKGWLNYTVVCWPLDAYINPAGTTGVVSILTHPSRPDTFILIDTDEKARLRVQAFDVWTGVNVSLSVSSAPYMPNYSIMRGANFLFTQSRFYTLLGALDGNAHPAVGILDLPGSVLDGPVFDLPVPNWLSVPRQVAQVFHGSFLDPATQTLVGVMASYIRNEPAVFASAIFALNGTVIAWRNTPKESPQEFMWVMAGPTYVP
eukprot:TRINITY_DN917_c0_g3_i1.p1 TRINITY_DN917_c0_g3~~TRINITY_DN917_c0_g3_i1.p1  ORF type:complete len:349 (-),score=29.51 TRINITY_DN917_c0_g3_i1:164-1210(-)